MFVNIIGEFNKNPISENNRTTLNVIMPHLLQLASGQRFPTSLCIAEKKLKERAGDIAALLRRRPIVVSQTDDTALFIEFFNCYCRLELSKLLLERADLFRIHIASERTQYVSVFRSSSFFSSFSVPLPQCLLVFYQSCLVLFPFNFFLLLLFFLILRKLHQLIFSQPVRKFHQKQESF